MAVMEERIRDYRKAYEAATSELESLLERQEETDRRIMSLRKTMNALSTLLQEAGDDAHWRDRAYARVEQVFQNSLTDDIFKVLNAAYPKALTTGDVRDELNKLGVDLSEQSNVMATVNAILNRLAESERAEKTVKDGRKAWKRRPLSVTDRGNII